MMKNNNTTIETQIIKHGDFFLKKYSVYDICFLFYKNNPIWEGKFNELFGTRLVDYVFEFEPDTKKAIEFIDELYKWSSTQRVHLKN